MKPEMDFLDFLNNFSNVTNNSNMIKTHFEKFTDENEYLGERIKSFLVIRYSNYSLPISDSIYFLYNPSSIF